MNYKYSINQAVIVIPKDENKKVFSGIVEERSYKPYIAGISNVVCNHRLYKVRRKINNEWILIEEYFKQEELKEYTFFIDNKAKYKFKKNEYEEEIMVLEKKIKFCERVIESDEIDL